MSCGVRSVIQAAVQLLLITIIALPAAIPQGITPVGLALKAGIALALIAGIALPAPVLEGVLLDVAEPAKAAA